MTNNSKIISLGGGCYFLWSVYKLSTSVKVEIYSWGERWDSSILQAGGRARWGNASYYFVLPVFSKFNFLGSLITKDGGCSQEIRHRLAMACSAMTNLSKTWADSGITRTTKVRLFQALVFPIALYASETWTLKQSWSQQNCCFWDVVLEAHASHPMDYEKDQCQYTGRNWCV